MIFVGAAIGRPFTGKPRMGFRVAGGNGRPYIYSVKNPPTGIDPSGDLGYCVSNPMIAATQGMASAVTTVHTRQDRHPCSCGAVVRGE